MHRTHADNFACGAGNSRHHAATFEFTDGLARAQKLTCQIDVDHGVPLIQCHFINRRISLQSGVIHQNINRAELGDHLAEHGLYLIFLRYIRLDGNGVPALGFDFIDHLMRCSLIKDIVHYNVSAFLCEKYGNASAYSGVRPRNQGILPA